MHGNQTEEATILTVDHTVRIVRNVIAFLNYYFDEVCIHLPDVVRARRMVILISNPSGSTILTISHCTH